MHEIKRSRRQIAPSPMDRPSRRASFPNRPAWRHTPTLDDVARLAGVSTATVSRCLNSPDRVVEQTRSRVMEVDQPRWAMRRISGRGPWRQSGPTHSARSFPRWRMRFSPAESRPFRRNLDATASRFWWRVRLSARPRGEQIRALISRGADALLLIGHDRSPESYEFLGRRHVPFLIAWAYDAIKPYLSIGFDNRQAMRALADQVLALGHRRVAMISALARANDRARDRADGITDAMRARRSTRRRSRSSRRPTRSTTAARPLRR